MYIFPIIKVNVRAAVINVLVVGVSPVAATYFCFFAYQNCNTEIVAVNILGQLDVHIFAFYS